jgi:hypothetical protein
VALRDSARDFAVAAFDFIAANNGFRRAETDTWVREGDVFVRHTWNRIVYRPEVSSLTLRMPQFAAFANELRHDGVLGQFFGKYVGPATGMGTVLNGVQLLNGLLPSDADPRAPRQALSFDEACFNVRFDDLMRFRDTESVPFLQIRPLVGLVCNETIIIDTGLSIEPMTDDEVIEALTWGVLPTHMNQYREFRREPGISHAIKRRYEAPRVALHAPPLDVPPVTEHWAYSSDGDDLAHALSIFERGRVLVGPTFLYSTMGWPYTIHTILQPTSFPDEPRGSRDTRLNPGVETDLRRIWAWLRTTTRAYRLAARRFYQGHLRGVVEDMLLDDIIAAEALFLFPHAKAKSRTIALNAAYYLGTDQQPERQTVFDLFRDAYVIRSAIVHGEEPDRAQMRVKGAPASFIEFEEAVERALRRALRKMVDQQQAGFAIDWTQIVQGPDP